MMKHPSLALALSFTLLTACTPSVPSNSETATSSSSSPLLAIASSSARSLSTEEKTAAWMRDFDIDVRVGDSLYGLTVASLEQPTVKLTGEDPVSGTLEWEIFYDLPTLFFIPDADVPEKFKREFVVVNSDVLPIRQGATVRATVDTMNILFMESNKPSTVTLRDVKIVGTPYETIPEDSAEWQYYLQLKQQAETDPTINL